MDLWSWATRPAALSFARNSTISTPYSETSPTVASQEHSTSKAQLNTAIFEVSKEDEYRSVAESFKQSVTAATPVAIPSKRLSSFSLLRLVQQRQWATANLMREEMIQHQLPIEPDPLFIHAARNAISVNKDAAERLKEFCGWLSLLPVANNAKKRPDFRGLISTINRNRHPDVGLIMAFVHICVSKGYTSMAPNHMIPIIVRFVTPSVSLQFLGNIRTLILGNLVLNKQERRKIRFWFYMATNEYLRCGLIEEAVKAFQIGSQYGPFHLDSTLRLGKAISKNPDHSALSQEIVAVLKQTCDRHINPSDPRKILSKVWDNALSLEPPNPHDIARFFEVFSPNRTAIHLLSRFIDIQPFRYRGQWILGQMLYYSRRKEWRELIGAFDAHFFRAGVPADIDADISRGSVNGPLTQGRIFPSSAHTALVWKAVVKLRRDGPLSMLFKELVEQVTASRGGNSARAEQLSVSASPGVFGLAHFTPFLFAADRNRRYTDLVAMCGEMFRLGIKPRARELSLLAGAHAIKAEGLEAIRTLDRMENLMEEERSSLPQRPAHDVSRDVALYIPALRNFLSRKDTAGAHLVRQRILWRGYVKGTNSKVDELLARLKTPNKAGR
jgi:hypothetical protein